MLTDPAGTNVVTQGIIGGGIKVHRALGPGLLESAYMPCMVLELEESGFTVELQKAVPLVYRNIRLDAGYRVDMIFNGVVVVELKSVEALAAIHRAQMLTYLKLTGCPVGLVINFNVPVGIKRIVNPGLSGAAEPWLTGNGVQTKERS
jgi:GxxExxY protein